MKLSNADRYLPLRDKVDPLQRVLALHHKNWVDGRTGDCARQECEHYNDECPTVPVPVCAHCFGMVEHLYEDDDMPWPSEVIWPCPTVSAAT